MDYQNAIEYVSETMTEEQFVEAYKLSAQVDELPEELDDNIIDQVQKGFNRLQLTGTQGTEKEQINDLVVSENVSIEVAEAVFVTFLDAETQLRHAQAEQEARRRVQDLTHTYQNAYNDEMVKYIESRRDSFRASQERTQKLRAEYAQTTENQKKRNEDFMTHANNLITSMLNA